MGTTTVFTFKFSGGSPVAFSGAGGGVGLGVGGLGDGMLVNLLSISSLFLLAPFGIEEGFNRYFIFCGLSELVVVVDVLTGLVLVRCSLI